MQDRAEARSDRQKESRLHPALGREAFASGFTALRSHDRGRVLPDQVGWFSRLPAHPPVPDAYLKRRAAGV